MYFPELARGREAERENYKKSMRWSTDRGLKANKIMKLKCGKSKGQIKNIVGAIQCSSEKESSGDTENYIKIPLKEPRRERKKAGQCVCELPV